MRNTNRWWIYQRERFPILAHGLLIAAFSLSAISFSSLLRGQVHLPGLAVLVAAFVSGFLFFLQLRIADEFKDFEEDSRYRPYRPVPRGLVSLRELGRVGVISAFIQLGLALWRDPSLAPLLLGVWGYLGLMRKEFFVPSWLKAHPIPYMGSHLIILPLILLYLTAWDWRIAGASPPRGLLWLCLIGFFSGMVVEIGRKIRAPQEEEVGVSTYSALWGYRRATLAWLGALLLTAVTAGIAADRIRFALPVSGLLGLLLIFTLVPVGGFLRRPVAKRARLIEQISGGWTLLIYLSLGAIPMVWRWLS